MWGRGQLRFQDSSGVVGRWWHGSGRWQYGAHRPTARGVRGLVQADDLEGALSVLVACLRACRTHLDTGFTLETMAAFGLVAAMVDRSDEERRLSKECDALTLAEWDGELTVSEPLRTAAGRCGIDISHERHRVLPLPSVADLLEEALALGGAMLTASAPTEDREQVPGNLPGSADRGLTTR